MKEQVLLYGVCAAISVAAVGITSIAKIIVCAIAKRAGKDISGNVKEYIFTPMALILAALGLYIWLENFMHVEDEEIFVLLIVCFSIGTMLIYWLLFQPTRKLATAIIHAIAKKANVEPVVDVIEGVLEQAESQTDGADGLQSNAKTEAAEQPSGQSADRGADETPETLIVETAADKLKAMVDAIKKK